MVIRNNTRKNNNNRGKKQHKAREHLFDEWGRLQLNIRQLNKAMEK